MIRELLESLKYVGHYFAIFFLRMYVGLYIFNLGLDKLYGAYLTEPLLAAQINEFLNISKTPAGIDYFFLNIVRPYWTTFSKLQVGIELGAGLLLILGFLVRPVMLIIIFYLWIFSYIQAPELWPWMSMLSAVMFSLGWAGAGRCMGVDYYFYKRYRGFLW